jgi:hypothetical protein
VVPGPAAATPINSPAGVVVDSHGNLYIGTLQSQILKVTPDGTLSIFAGDGTSGAATPGPATSSHLGQVYDLAVDRDDNVYAAGYLPGPQVSRITPTGTLSIVAGSGTSGSPVQGPAAASPFQGPIGVAVDFEGTVYVGDYSNQRVVAITSDGTLSYLAGTGSPGTATNGPALATSFRPLGLGIDNAGNVYAGVPANVPYAVKLAILHAPGSAGTPVATLASDAVTASWTAPTLGGVPTSYTVTPIVDGVAQAAVTGITGTSYAVTAPVGGSTYAFTVQAVNDQGVGPVSAASNTVTFPRPAVPAVPAVPASGYWLVGADGGVFSYGAPFHGSTGDIALNQPIVAAAAPDSGGYWFVARDGGVFAFGDVGFAGSLPQYATVSDIVGMAADPDGSGYWLVGADGGVYAFDAAYHGSLPGSGVTASDVVAIAATATGSGYYVVEADGTVRAFGDAVDHGSLTGTALSAPIVGIGVDPTSGGYWLVGADGSVYAFGGAPFLGSTASVTMREGTTIVAILPSAGGYRLVGSDGGVFAFGTATFQGSAGSLSLAAPIVTAAAPIAH